MGQTDIGVSQVAERIHGRLQRYLEAQYHIRDSSLIEERRDLLREAGAISQRPFVEVTPSYAVEKDFSGLKIPAPVKSLLSELLGWKPSIGVYPPYRHQADALEHYFSDGADGSDLIVATGTGSGKTETFLYSILGSLTLEATHRPDSFSKNAVRALLLYPMNALVSDQTARLRRLLGDPRLSELWRKRWGRHPLFGMYTSRTPYPGVRSSSRDQTHIASLLKYFVDLEESNDVDKKDLVKELKARGRWPAKDVVGFFGKAEEEEHTYKSGNKAGKTYTKHKWEERLVTQQGDRELLTRHEMQACAPDLLVTNYSMLEYMLLRPIERSIFKQTAAWLAENNANQLLLILDEAHMYRGVAGAEVGLLIRRLQSRLGIRRDQLRCILTSASLGTGAAAEAAGRAFARGLTGARKNRDFGIVRGTREARKGAQSGTAHEAAAFAKADPVALAGAQMDLTAALGVIEAVGSELNWPPRPALSAGEEEIRTYVARALTGTGPLELLLEECAGRAVAFEALAQKLFPGLPTEVAERATDGLLALGCFARRWEKGRQEQPLLPTRVHMLFRGLPSVHACINPQCTERRVEPGKKTLLGRLYTEPRTHCVCGARVYEIYTHRDCGVAFLRAFGFGRDTAFLWNERGGKMTEFGKPLHEIHLLLEEPHPDEVKNVEPVWLDIATGRVYETVQDETKGFRLVYRPTGGDDTLSTFGRCPLCTRRTATGRTFKIMDLATKGEQPFANLIREQFVNQVPTKPLDDRHPNEGKKALLFSDGRQKAARLARDLPREVEQDSFREAVILAVSELKKAKPDATPNENLYVAFVSVCARHHLHFFDGDDQTALIEDCERFRKDYESSLDLAFSEEWRPQPKVRYRQALLRQISDPYYSLVAACAAVVEPRQARLRKVQNRIGGLISAESLVEVASQWVKEMLDHSAFDPALSLNQRELEFPYFEAVRAEDGLKKFFEDLKTRSGLDAEGVKTIRESLFEVFTSVAQGSDDSGRLLLPDSLVVNVAIDDTWQQCRLCGNVQPKPYLGSCANCGHKTLEARPPDHPYMTARKGFFREPLRAVLQGQRPIHITAEEHTAQLSQRDTGVVYATTEEFELRFQDVPLGPAKPPVDILSCTTTMEVGIDIGSLTAVGLRTVPPLRENYQQRAGRAGRRGTSVSSVLTFAQGGAHDAHYFEHPEAIISGPPREPRIKSDNKRLARRHIYSYLLQTFFHTRIDLLSEEEESALAAERPDLMSAFGNASDFFVDDGEFTFAEFERWIDESVLRAGSDVAETIVAWLPDEIAANEKDPRKARMLFVRQVAKDLVEALRAIGEKLEAKDNEDEEGETGTPSGSLLDLLFDRGLLPSYAFPTDLCSFVVQERGEHGRIKEKERPQLGKTQALSEYAPGRLLVINKKTYRVGGVFFDGPPSASPAEGIFGGIRTRYIGCPRCTYVTLDETEDVARELEEKECPVCGEELQAHEILDPPAFSPEEARPVKESDREQDITYASSAQLPELVEQDFPWKERTPQLQYAHAEGVKLIVANKGQELEGFAVCEKCGAAWICDDKVPAKPHRRPFLVPHSVMMKEQAPPLCNGAIRRDIYLGHQFRTDILLLRLLLRPPMDFSPKQPWLYDALATFAESLAIGASLTLTIDPGELSSGFRLVHLKDGTQAAEIYLFDTASGGAGYAFDAGENLEEVLAQVEQLLKVCPGECERSCTKCLRHYGNRFHHPRLDRRLGLKLLRYARFGEIPVFEGTVEQAKLLEPLARYIELEGWKVRRAGQKDGVVVPLLATPPLGGTEALVGTYPALVTSAEAAARHSLRTKFGRVAVLLPDYLVEQDLPSAYQEFLRQQTPSARVKGTP
ncbi:MAG: DEAD/DEAH box helicase [Acidobacteria bacterium]|nr:DEAD/DEAH box helicase [Acidobacteriota bacterium]